MVVLCRLTLGTVPSFDLLQDPSQFASDSQGYLPVPGCFPMSCLSSSLIPSKAMREALRPAHPTLTLPACYGLECRTGDGLQPHVTLYSHKTMERSEGYYQLCLQSALDSLCPAQGQDTAQGISD